MKKHIPFVAYRKVYNWTIKYVVLLFICALFGLCSVYIYFFYSQSTIGENIMDEPIPLTKQDQKVIFNGKKFVHLDLKGAPPKVTYYEYLFPLLAKNGVAGVVIEYEDTFPFKGILHNVSALNAYTRKEIDMINNLADKNRLEIVPLVQTFGHLEFVLKLEEFRELREVPAFPQVLCPSNTKSLHIVSEMLTQIIEAHPYTATIHIGADETHYLGRCKECITRMKFQNITGEGLYLKHIENVRDFLRRKFPLLKILMWDDMLRNFSEEETVNGFDKLGITPVVWQYETDVFNALGPSLWGQYSRQFKKVWIASAFKGAAGVDQYIVDVSHYNQNHRSWMDVVENYKFLLKFEAIILTGWQRYDHFSILCELLPVAIPSLLMNLKILDGDGENRFGPTKEVAQILNCQQPYALMGPSFGSPQCAYPGSDILENVYRLHQLEEDYRELRKSSSIKGWMSSYNIHHNFSSPGHIYNIAPHLSHLGQEIKEIENDMSKALLEVYDDSTKNEWIFTFIQPLKKEINELLRVKDELLKRKVWPRRPFKYEVPQKT
ncbi:hexosaminidase D-like [Coccinella septempunctata]|uniref:hexosaminidase D-like n=1 Tax=Coccinella septempunctata TaxID=41139 RepID=UPI001D07E2E2|nr:hexosaminidase D-like [Coccinella septempunctata]